MYRIKNNCNNVIRTIAKTNNERLKHKTQTRFRRPNKKALLLIPKILYNDTYDCMSRDMVFEESTGIRK